MDKYKVRFILCTLSDKEKIKLIEEFGDCKNIYERSINNKYINTKIREKILESLNIDTTAFEHKLKSLEIDFVTFDSELYPEKLKYIESPPYALFFKGDIKSLSLNINISIVGSRRCTEYGEEVTKGIIKSLKGNKVNIISGGAKGIDTVAHKKSLDEGVYTCSVLGSGIDIAYPKENYMLYEKIVNRGCVISEFLPGTPPFSYNFPRRNRIISGLSDLIIIIEAGEKSGTLITANYALEQGKDVMVVPGSIFWGQSRGCNNLIKDGAYVYTEPKDIFEILGLKNNENVIVKGDLSGIKGKVYGVLKDKPIHIDDIMRMTNIDIKVLYELLFEMQLKEEILCLSGNYYVRNIGSI